MKQLKESLVLIDKCEKIFPVDFVKYFMLCTNQSFSDGFFESIKYSCLDGVYMITTDFLHEYGYKNIYECENMFDDFNRIKASLCLIDEYKKKNNDVLLTIFSIYSNQIFDENLINDAEKSSLFELDILTSDFLNGYGYMNLLQFENNI